MAAPWSAGRLKTFVISALRSATRRFPPKYETLNEAKTVKKINEKTGRLAQHFLCASCQLDFPAKDVNVDHKVPVVDPVVGFTTWDEYIERMFCDKDNFQILCRGCHDIKTKGEKVLKSTTQSKRPKAPSSSKASSRRKKSNL